MKSGNSDCTASLDDAGYQLLCARYVRKQIKQLAAQIDGVRRADDVEYVHRARVATRRLRAGLQMFTDCYDSGTIKRWRKAIRRLTKGLGDARDTDVQADFLVSVLNELENREHYPGIARLLVKVDRRREKAQPEVNAAMEQFESSGVLREISSETKKTISALGKRDVSIQSPTVFQKAGQHVLARLDEFVEFQDCLADAEQDTRHHAMRIAAKRLRYTMEICKPAYENQLDEFITSAKEVQSLLGEIHDCDVWIGYLAKFLKKEGTRIVKFFGHDEPLARLRAGIDFLEQQRRQQRVELFAKLGDYWAELQRQKLWDNLRVTVRERSQKPELSPDVVVSEVDCAVSSALGGPHVTSTVASADLTSAPPRTDS